ncbi:MAG: ABC transporter ATP-binding protein, partial [Deltaproteobacteria bacterium]
MADPEALQLWGVRKRYGVFRKHEALRGVSIRVEPGECYGLAGPNGAGKTTLIRILLGLSLPDDGEVRVFGQRPDDPEVRRRIGFVPEAAELSPQASPRRLVRRFALLRGLELREAEPQGIAQLERLGMSELLERPAGKLSKGEKQRTLLALALMGSPDLLILDEPTDGLDPMGRA